MGLITKDGMILRVGSELAGSTDCCCYPEGPCDGFYWPSTISLSWGSGGEIDSFSTTLPFGGCTGFGPSFCTSGVMDARARYYGLWDASGCASLSGRFNELTVYYYLISSVWYGSIHLASIGAGPTYIMTVEATIGAVRSIPFAVACSSACVNFGFECFEGTTISVH